MFKLVRLVSFFLICLLLNTQGFSAQIITRSGEGGGIGIVSPKGETFVFYSETSGEVSIKECVTNRTFFENNRYDCIKKEGTQIETLSQADFRNHLKSILSWLPIQNYNPLVVQVNLKLWRKNKLAMINIDQLRKDRDKIKFNLTQIERVILAYRAESTNMEEKQVLESELAQIELQLEVYSEPVI